MASASDVDEVRLNTNVSADDDVFTYNLLLGYVDALGVAGATAKVWKQKAAIAADLVDISEAGASERLSQLQDGANTQAKYWQAIADEESGISTLNNRAKTHALSRTLSS